MDGALASIRVPDNQYHLQKKYLNSRTQPKYELLKTVDLNFYTSLI